MITQVNSTHPHKLSLNIKRLVIKLIIKLTLGFEENENALAKRIIKDLEPLKDKKDIDFVNNILTPLLKAEKKISISFDFFDKKMQTFHTFTNAIEECRDSPKVDNFLSYPLYSNIIPHLERIVGRSYNSQKMIISDWKPIFLSKKEGTASFKDMLTTIENKTSLFFVFEGVSKKIGDNCYFGIYNRNAVYKDNEQFLTNASDDHFCFATLGKNDYYCFQMKEGKPIIDFKNVRGGEVNFAQGFVHLKHKVSLSKIGMVVKDSHSEIQISKGYNPLQDFKIEKFTIYELGGMKENSSDSVSQNSQANPIQPLYNKLVDKYHQSESLDYFKENCFFGKFLTLIL